ncbi:MAG TPA: hypothetical protein VGV93_02200 [Acidimicrobiales bacterium]|nr:hypothetical protein [Acidimicrobiales bacterium]
MVIASFDTFYNGFIPIQPRVANALGIPTREGEAQRFRIAYAMAEGLDISTEHLGSEGCAVLLSLLPALEGAAAQASKRSAAEAIRTTYSVIDEETESLELDRLLLVLDQFGWSQFSPPLRIASTSELFEEVAARLEESLKHRTYRMVDMWRLRGWNDTAPAEMPRRVIRSSNARPQGG